MEPYITSKKKLTEEDLQWCRNALAKAEPYSEEEANSIPLAAEIYEFDFARLVATRAKKCWNVDGNIKNALS
ncbi:MAG: hypothetical protein K2G25_03570, partial [Oscillospiraceae bacterium]|nr:hypothetical protein [Oscillospiraceae bacterium]